MSRFLAASRRCSAAAFRAACAPRPPPALQAPVASSPRDRSPGRGSEPREALRLFFIVCFWVQFAGDFFLDLFQNGLLLHDGLSAVGGFPWSSRDSGLGHGAQHRSGKPRGEAPGQRTLAAAPLQAVLLLLADGQGVCLLLPPGHHLGQHPRAHRPVWTWKPVQVQAILEGFISYQGSVPQEQVPVHEPTRQEVLEFLPSRNGTQSPRDYGERQEQP